MNMKILLTGATGYIGKRILPMLVHKGYHVVCCVRDVSRFNPPQALLPSISILKIDLLDIFRLLIMQFQQHKKFAGIHH